MDTNTQHVNQLPAPVRTRLLGDGNSAVPGLAHTVAARLLAASGYHTRKHFQSPGAIDGLATIATDALVATIGALSDDQERTMLYLDLLERWLDQEAVVGELSQVIDPRFDSELDLAMLAQEFVALGEAPALPENQSLMEAAIARFVSEFHDAMTRQLSSQRVIDAPVDRWTGRAGQRARRQPERLRHTARFVAAQRGRRKRQECG